VSAAALLGRLKAAAVWTRHAGRMTEAADLGPTGGVVWSTPAEWENRRKPEGCVICTSGQPLDIIAELPSTWATAQRVAPLPGYVCVVAKQHVVEPFEMTADDQCRFWRDVMLVARAVAEVAHPIKMNYEIHGNTLPHPTCISSHARPMTRTSVVRSIRERVSSNGQTRRSKPSRQRSGRRSRKAAPESSS
jgi:diadenosine tetraphosphate (Ap4A) HIT family hydrolase